MYELILHSQIAAGRHDQVLHILAGVAAMQPVEIVEQTLVYQQLKAVGAPAASKKGATNQTALVQRLRYHKLVRDISNNDTPGDWKLRTEETPDAGIKDVNARTISENVISEEQMERFRPGSEWYKFITQYVAKGSRFVHGNVVIRLFRLLTLKKPSEDNPINVAAPASPNLEFLDKSGAYLVEVYVRTEDSPSPALRDKATEELVKFAKTLEGAVDLRAINRLAMDTSIKSN